MFKTISEVIKLKKKKKKGGGGSLPLACYLGLVNLDKSEIGSQASACNENDEMSALLFSRENKDSIGNKLSPRNNLIHSSNQEIQVLFHVDRRPKTTTQKNRCERTRMGQEP